jgi:hypothetical protein
MHGRRGTNPTPPIGGAGGNGDPPPTATPSAPGGHASNERPGYTYLERGGWALTWGCALRVDPARPRQGRDCELSSGSKTFGDRF